MRPFLGSPMRNHGTDREDGCIYKSTITALLEPCSRRGSHEVDRRASVYAGKEGARFTVSGPVDKMLALDLPAAALFTAKGRYPLRPKPLLAGSVVRANRTLSTVRRMFNFAIDRPWKLRPRYVPYRNVDSLQSVFSRTRVRESINLPKLVPYSIRHKMTTILRARQVPEAPDCSLARTQEARISDYSYIRRIRSKLLAGRCNSD